MCACVRWVGVYVRAFTMGQSNRVRGWPPRRRLLGSSALRLTFHFRLAPNAASEPSCAASAASTSAAASAAPGPPASALHSRSSLSANRQRRTVGSRHQGHDQGHDDHGHVQGHDPGHDQGDGLCQLCAGLAVRNLEVGRQPSGRGLSEPDGARRDFEASKKSEGTL